jgi:hypothetical protein
MLTHSPRCSIRNGTVDVLGWCEDLLVTCERALSNASYPAAGLAQTVRSGEEGAAGQVSERDRYEVTEIFMRLNLATDYYYYSFANASSHLQRHAGDARRARGSRARGVNSSKGASGRGWMKRRKSEEMRDDDGGGSLSSRVRSRRGSGENVSAGELGSMVPEADPVGAVSQSQDEGLRWIDRIEESHLTALLQDSIARLNTTGFPRLIQQELLGAGVSLVRVEWAAVPVLCTRPGKPPRCNLTLLLDMLQDRELLLALAWGEFPTIDLLRDPFATLTFFVASLAASLVLYASIRCQQARMAKLRRRAEWGSSGAGLPVRRDEVMLLQLHRRSQGEVDEEDGL